MNGYASQRYAMSLTEFGQPLALQHCKGHVLVRNIPSTPYADAVGCYPLFNCDDWDALHKDLTWMASDGGPDLVALALVTDPFGDYNEALLASYFPDLARPYKNHFVVDLNEPANVGVTKHHRYYAQRSIKSLDIDICESPYTHYEEWVSLYQQLTERHQLTGVQAFSPAAFSAQLQLTGMTMIRALYEDTCVSAHLWITQGDVVHSHLAASSKEGYRLMAPYAVYATALQWFRGRARWLNLGAGSGVEQDDHSGLTRFKSGWTKLTRPSWLCGIIFNPSTYHALTAETGKAGAPFFPAYRAGSL